MKFTFEYKETLVRTVNIDAKNLEDAISEMKNQIDTQKIVLGAEDFAGGEIRMPLEENVLPRLQFYGDSVDEVEGMSILIDMW